MAQTMTPHLRAWHSTAYSRRLVAHLRPNPRVCCELCDGASLGMLCALQTRGLVSQGLLAPADEALDGPRYRCMARYNAHLLFCINI